MTSADGYFHGRYKLLSEIGSGGMGKVHLAEDTKLDRHVAIKFLNEKYSQDQEKLKRFIQEAKATSALNHPNICTVYEFGDTGEHSFIAMSFIDGLTLRQKINSAYWKRSRNCN